jgi:hypothetical protein
LNIKVRKSDQSDAFHEHLRSDDGEELPSDYYGVIVEDEMDRRRLRWLVQKIGETKLRASVQKYKDRYVGSLPYVSTLLKWYRLKVPVAAYAPVRVPVYVVYLLVHRGGSAVKVGSSGFWIQRVASMVPLGCNIDDVFDLELSVALTVPSKSVAGAVERTILARTSELRCEAPFACQHGDGGVTWSAGQTEWRFAQARELVERLLIQSAGGSPLLSLKLALVREAVLQSA